MRIAISNQETFFAAFYILAFAVTFVIVIVFSIRQKIPLRSVLLMLTTVSLFTIIGSRLSTIPIIHWSRIIRTGFFDGYNSRSAVGGIFFGLAGLILSKRYLGLGMPVINLYAWMAPLGFGIQKIGCFFNGCCYGNLSNLPWSVQYPSGTNAHYYQWVHGMIDNSAAYSLSVHPVQLYETLALFSVAFIAFRSRRLWKRDGSILIFALCLFCIFRFATEFFRDPSSSNFAGNKLWGLKELQWLLLLIGIFCGLVLIVYEKYYKADIKRLDLITPSPGKSILYIIAVSTVFYVFRGLFTKFELASIDMKFLPAILLTAIHAFKTVPSTRIRVATTSFLVFPMFLLTRTFPQDTAKLHQSIKEFYKYYVTSYKRIDFGTSIGNYNGNVLYNPHEGQCGTEYTIDDYQYKFRLAGMGFSSVKYADKSITTMGINLFGGVDKENNLTISREKTFYLFGIDPYFKYDRKWIGLGAGIQVGNLRWIPTKVIDQTTFDNGTRFSPVLPEVSLRFGRKDILDIRYEYGLRFPSSLPVLMSEFSLGSGFGSKANFSFRYGVSMGNESGNLFLSAEGIVSKKIGLNIRYNFESWHYKGNTYLLAGANYRFGFKE